MLCTVLILNKEGENKSILTFSHLLLPEQRLQLLSVCALSRCVQVVWFCHLVFSSFYSNGFAEKKKKGKKRVEFEKAKDFAMTSQ